MEIEKEIIRIGERLGVTVLYSDLESANVEIDNFDKYEGIYFQLVPILKSKLFFGKIQSAMVTREYDVTVRFMFFHEGLADTLFRDENYTRRVKELRQAEVNFAFLLKTSELAKMSPYNTGSIVEAGSDSFFYFTDSNLWGLELSFKITLREEVDCDICLPKPCENV